MHFPDQYDLDGLSYDGKNLRANGKVVTLKRGNRLFYCSRGLYFDAASLAFYLALGKWPLKRLKFLDGDYTNLSVANMVMCDCRGNPAKMQKQHAAYMQESAKIDTFKPAPASGFEWVSHKGYWLQIPVAKGPWDDRQLRIDAVLRQRETNGGAPQ